VADLTPKQGHQETAEHLAEVGKGDFELSKIAARFRVKYGNWEVCEVFPGSGLAEPDSTSCARYRLPRAANLS
jgi:hypothetical protein